MTREQAIETLRLCGIPRGADFHRLCSNEVTLLIDAANNWKYRAPRYADGSRARYFHAFVQRRAAERKAA